MNTLVKRGSLFPAMNSFFDDFLSKDLFDWNDKNFATLGSTLPSVNLKETDNTYEIEMAAPGMKKEDFKIELDKGLLTISSEQRSNKEEKDEKGNYTRREFNYQSFCRSFTLPDTVAEDDIQATYKDGILHIAVPKKQVEKVKTAKTIDIR